MVQPKKVRKVNALDDYNKDACRPRKKRLLTPSPEALENRARAAAVAAVTSVAPVTPVAPVTNDYGPRGVHVRVVVPSRTSVGLPADVIVIDDSDDEALPTITTRRKLAHNPDLELVNTADNEDLPANFTFVNDYVFVGDTKRLEPEFRTGCECGTDNGRNVGCEYVQKCQCLDDMTEGKDGRKIGFPYHAEGSKKGCLQAKFLSTRDVLYECSDLCNCGPRCRNKVVQHGRKIGMEIFRTSNGRGWGLRSTQPVQKGQFIDTYRGEVITDAEATRREQTSSNSTKDSYLFSLDKFRDFINDDSKLYVVDGEFMGGPTRFINHSCDPNCAIFAVSTTRGDDKVYELAFFALENIPAYTELTFDYLGEEADERAEKDEDKVKAKEKVTGKMATRCRCGSDNCRGFLWL